MNPTGLMIGLLYGMLGVFFVVFIRFCLSFKPTKVSARQPLNELIGNAVADGIVASLSKAERENTPLTKPGFDWALYIALKSYWPEIDRATAVRWLREYINVPHGADGYSWTVSAANELARLYVEEFGEAT